jgi:hypothetical protein
MNNVTPVGFAFICPSIMLNNRYSSFRQYFIENNQIVNYKAYTTSLEDTIQNDRVEYKLYYDAKENYGLKSFDAKGYYDLYQRMKSNDTLVQLYHQHYNPGFNNNYCDSNCKQSYLDEIIMKDIK